MREQIKRVQQALQQCGADALLCGGNRNVFYLTGTIVQGYCYVPATGEPLLFSRRGGGIFFRRPTELADLVQKQGLSLPKRLLLDEGDLSAAEWSALCKAFPSSSCEAGTALLRQVRSVKTPEEIEIIRQAAAKHAQVSAQFPSLYRPGMTDTEFSIELEYFARKNGHLGVFRTFGFHMEAFMGSLLVGDNAAAVSPFDFALGGAGSNPILPIGATGKVMEAGESVMVDLSGCYSSYVTDLSRTYSIGKLPDIAYHAHQVSIEIQQELSLLSKPGAVTGELYEKAVSMAQRAGLEDHFMGTAFQSKFVGHGMGIEINELPVLCKRGQAVLEAGNVLALEPKFVLEGIGAVGTENTYLVTENGLELLTPCEETLLDLTK